MSNTDQYTFNPGDKVAYSTQFLRSIGESHGSMARARGVVIAREVVTDGFVVISIDWDTPVASPRVRDTNLAKVGPNSRFCNC